MGRFADFDRLSLSPLETGRKEKDYSGGEIGEGEESEGEKTERDGRRYNDAKPRWS